MKQMSIICKGGSPVTEITELLGAHDIDIRDLNFHHQGDDAILNLVADDSDKCWQLLTEHGYAVIADETLLLKVEDKLGMLAKVSRSIADLGVDIRSLTLLNINNGGDVVAVSTSDNDKVRALYGEQVIN